jgi:hypothetical protein
MTPDELLTHLEAELARCSDQRDRLQADLELATVERDRALAENAHLQRSLFGLLAESDAAEHRRERLYQEFRDVVDSKSWRLTRPLRRLRGSDRAEVVEER